MANIEFNNEEISIIEKNLGFIVFDWAKHLISHVITQARNAGVKTVYMNTIDTLDAGAITEGKVDYFYERLPGLLGFKKEKANLRGKGAETLWAYHLDTINASFITSLLKIAKRFTLEELPKKYQGAFIGIKGRKPFYTEEEVSEMFDILQGKRSKPKTIPKFSYDWSSATWSGCQRFRNDITEVVVLQRPTDAVKNAIVENEAMSKFWALVLSQYQHGFASPDVIGFGLISKISRDAWVINEIQTDCINAYMKLRRIDQKKYEERKEKITWEVLTHMLEAENKTKWIPILETNDALREQILSNPNIIAQLPDNSQDVNKWIEEQRAVGVTEGLGLIEHFQSVDFNRGIFRL